MSASGTDSIGVLLWGVRRYWFVLIACVLLGAVVTPWSLAQRSTAAEAEALVLAQRLDMDLEALPRYGEAVFGNGEVALAVATAVGGVGDRIVPERVSLVTEQDSLVMRVVGRDEDPATAANLANIAAEAFVQALNSTGAGIGLFALQSSAEAPASGSADAGVGTAVGAVVGGSAGLLLGLAVIAFLLVARRPVIAAGEAEEMTGVPTLGAVTVPRTGRGSFAPPEAFRGLVPVCRRLLAMPTPTVLLVGFPRDRALRDQLSVAMASVIMKVRPVTLVGPVDAQAVVTRRASAVDSPTAPSTAAAPPVTIVDSRDPIDFVRPPQHAVTVLVVPIGISSARLREAAAEHLGGSAESRILLVDRRGRAQGETDDRAGDDRPARPVDTPEQIEPVDQR
jgi:hypothetical protein